jgi:hypothetical protein
MSLLWNDHLKLQKVPEGFDDFDIHTPKIVEKTPHNTLKVTVTSISSKSSETR